MKRTLIALAFLAAIARPANAGDYTVTLSTIVPTASAAEFTAGAYPTINKSVYVRNLTLTNSGGAIQTVTLYKNASSYTAAAVAETFVLTSTGTYVYDFPAQTFQVNKPAIKKSDTGSAVTATFIYQ